MKRNLSVLIIIGVLWTVSCGDDPGKGRVELAISTEDGIENFGSIVPSGPSYATTPSWLNELQVLAYSGEPATGTLVMSESYPVRALISGEYLSVEVPAVRELYFVIHALDGKKVIQYTGSTGPVHLEPKIVVALNVVMQKMVSVPTKDLLLTLDLKYYQGKNFSEELNRCGISNVYANIYTRAVKIDDQWVPTNPDDGVNYSVGGSYSSSQWTGGNFLRDALQFITVHAEDNTGSVIFYGVQVYDHRWGYNYNNTSKPLPVFMRHPSKLVVTLTGSNLPNEASIKMFINGDWRDLYIDGTTSTTFDATATNPVVVDAPSGEGWFTGAPVQTRQIQVFTGGSPWGSAEVDVDWGVSTVTITGQ